VRDLEELRRHIRGYNELNWRTAERHYQAAVTKIRKSIIESGRTQQWAPAQERDDAILREHVTGCVGGLRDFE
jgi:hypothetical protein